jgi:proteasome lid subunit RPN8/RPN11
MTEKLARAARGAWPSTPLLIKRDDEFEWPEDQRMFYLLANTGLFKCRNHEFFRSCVPAHQGPSELADQEPLMECSFPLIPRVLFERVVGFFDQIRLLHNSEVSVLLAYDRENEAVELVVPEQTATVIRYSDGWQHPIGLHYYPPLDLPPSWVVFGDIHSHVDLAAYSSGTDVHDETHSAGLHIVIGRLYREPMDVHVEAVVDGERFEMKLEDVVEGYEARSLDVPDEWMGKVEIEATSASSSWSVSEWASGWVGSTSAKDEGAR